MLKSLSFSAVTHTHTDSFCVFSLALCSNVRPSAIERGCNIAITSGVHLTPVGLIGGGVIGARGWLGLLTRVPEKGVFQVQGVL